MTETVTPTVVYLGNRSAVETDRDPDDDEGTALSESRPVRRVRRELPGKRCTTVVIPAGMGLLDAAHEVTHARGVWQAHSDSDSPAWVASTNQVLAELLAAHYSCELRHPEPDHDAGG